MNLFKRKNNEKKKSEDEIEENVDELDIPEDTDIKREFEKEDKERVDEYEHRSKKIEKRVRSGRPSQPAAIGDQSQVTFTRRKIIRDLDKIKIPKGTTQIMNELPTITIAKMQMLQRRRDKKIIDEEIRSNLKEENDEFNSEVDEEYDELYDDDDLDDFDDL